LLLALAIVIAVTLTVALTVRAIQPKGRLWNSRLDQITQLSLPDPLLVEAYKAGFVATEIDRSGFQLDTGTNNYHAEFEHDVIGIP
jgi:hypothetical protein